MDRPVITARLDQLPLAALQKIDDILDKHGFGRVELRGDFHNEVNELANKFCSVIIHLDKTVDDLQYKLAAAREAKK